MRMRSLAKAWALAAALVIPASALSSPQIAIGTGQTLSCRPAGNRTTCNLASSARNDGSFTLEGDGDIRPGSPVSLKLIARTYRVLIFVDSHPSKPGGLQLCQAGRESFLRVISTDLPGPSETFHIKLESCRHNYELALEGISWDASSRSLRLHWLQSPKDGKDLEMTLHINDAGHVVE